MYKTLGELVYYIMVLTVNYQDFIRTNLAIFQKQLQNKQLIG